MNLKILKIRSDYEYQLLILFAIVRRYKVAAPKYKCYALIKKK